LIWGGRYLPLFTSPEMLDVYADVELGIQFDPPVQIGEPWELRLPTSLVMLQADDTLPEFPPRRRRSAATSARTHSGRHGSVLAGPVAVISSWSSPPR
jgi:hypothetical protein